MTGVRVRSRKGAWQVGARTPHPALAVLLVIGAAVAGRFLAGFISPDYIANTGTADILGNARNKYLLAHLIDNLVFYAAVLAPAVSLAKSLKDRCVGGIAMVFYGKAPRRLGWMIVLVSALVISFYELGASSILQDGTYGDWRTLGIAIFPLSLGGILGFEKRSDVEAELADIAEVNAAKRVPKSFWPEVRWHFYLALTVAVVVLLWCLAVVLDLIRPS